MDAFTLTLIAIGVLAVIALVVLGFLEIKRNLAAKHEAPFPGRVEKRAPARVSVQTAAVPPADSESTSAQVGVQDPPEAASETEVASAPAETPSEEVRPLPAATAATLTDGQRKALARLTIMTDAFDRDVAVAVADCTAEDVEALVQAGMLVADETGGRIDLTAAARGGAAPALAPGEAHDARVRHAEYFISLGEEAIAARGDGGVKAPGGVAAPPVVVFADERAHFEAAYSFLEHSSELAPQLFRLVDAVGWGHAIQLAPSVSARWAEAAFGAARTMGDRAAERDALGHLGGARTDEGAHKEALAAYEQAAEISRELEDRHNEARFIGNAALSRHRMGDPASAIEDYAKVVEIMRELGDKGREGIALASLGQAEADLGNHEKAVEYFEQFLELTIETGDERASGLALGHLGQAQAALGNHAKSAEMHERELKVAEHFRDLPSEGHALNGVGDASVELGNIDRAIQCFTRCVDVAHLLKDGRSGVRAIGKLGLCHLKADRASKALECFEEQLTVARKIGDREGEGQALWNAARVVHSRGQVADAITRASAALPILDEIKSPEAEKLRAQIAEWRA